MKNYSRFSFLTLVGLLAFVPVRPGFAADEISAADAAKHVGETVTVTDKVESAHQAKGGNIFFDMGGRHPNQALTIFVGADNAAAFKDLKEFEGKTVSVTGKVEDHKGKPQIVIKAPSDLTAKSDGAAAVAASPAASTSPSPAASASASAHP